MDKLIHILIVIIFTAISVSLGADIHIYPGDSIQAAIERANIGDTIYVTPSVYRENLVVSKALFLKGIATGETKPIIDADGRGNAILISAEDTSIDGFIIINANGDQNRAGICIISNNCEISDNIIQNNGNGIFIRNSSGNVVTRNFISYNKYGIHIKNSSNITLYNNIVFNNSKYNAYDTGNNSWHKDNIGNYYNEIIYNIPGGGSQDLHPIGVKYIYINNSEQYPIYKGGGGEEIDSNSLINYIYIVIIFMVAISLAAILIIKKDILSNLVDLLRSVLKYEIDSEYYCEYRSRSNRDNKNDTEREIDVEFEDITNSE